MRPKRLARKPNVLAVDDKRANLLALEVTLGTEYNVIFAHSGQEAISIVERRPEAVDLILMDVQMPEIDGYEATRCIRGRESAGRRVPILAMTAHAMKGDRERCLAAGMDGYVAKPFDVQELVNAVRHAIHA
ncbi:MAG: response regulator [Terriglobia bacterium]